VVVVPRNLDSPLSAGELAALQLAASGYTSKQIARRLGTSEQGIHLRLKSATTKLHARSRTHAVVIALRRRVIDFGDVEMPSTASRGPRTGVGGRESASSGVKAARVARDAVRPSGGRTATRGEAAA
jgi:DNA-binding CsgD family transcriptional regulator